MRHLLIISVLALGCALLQAAPSNPIARQVTNILRAGELVLHQPVRLKNGVDADTYLFRKTDWLLKDPPQSAFLSQQMDLEARKLPEAERLRTMDKYDDHIQIWTVPLAKYPQAGADLKQFLPPTDQPNRYYRELAYLGRDQLHSWYGYMPIYDWILLQREAKLTAGDDPLEAAARGLLIQDQSSMTRNSVGYTLAEAGARALPYLRPILNTTNYPAALSVIATIQAPEATRLLLQIATGTEEEQARAARALLQDYPRPEAKDLYFTWLETQAGHEPVQQLLRVCANLDKSRTARTLPRILEHPKSLGEFRQAFELSRPIPQSLLQLEQTIKTCGFASSTNYNQAKVDAAVSEVIRTSDPEAAAVIGLSLAAATTKGDWRPANAAGIQILRNIKNGEKTALRVAESVNDTWLAEKLKPALPQRN